ncbi:MAG: hypothetical protein GXO75_11620, partial [Calditrichaeota bacterium]|nr:hypothetical protein [Calditrichota bacterium]
MKISHFSFPIFILFLFVFQSFAQNWITHVYPSQNSLYSTTNTNIRITFDRPIDQNSISDSTISITGSFTGTNTINSVNYDGTTNTLILSCTYQFMAGEKISVVLTRNIKDAQGNNIPSPFSWSFYTKTKSGKRSFGNKTSIYVGKGMKSIALGDLDNDTDLDLVLTESSSNSIMIFWNSGDGNFSDTSHIQVSGKIGDIAIGDFDRDGKLDLAVVITTHVSLYKNLGNLEFSKTYSSSGFRDYISDIIACDFNSDGYLDLAISHYSNALLEFKVSLLKNDKNGKFRYGGYFKTGVYASEMITEDFDNSGFFDIAITTPGQGVSGEFGGINIHKNSDNFKFILLENIGSGRPFRLSGGDVNNDNYVDIIDSKGRIFLNDGTGKMKLDTTLITDPYFDKDLINFDFNGDSNIDIVYADGKVFQNNGNATFSLIENLGTIGFRLLGGDLNGDGTIDLVGMDNDEEKLNFIYNIYNKINNNDIQQKSFILKQN